MYLLDTNTCIQFLNGKSASIERRLMGTKPSNIKLCSIVKAEMYFGAARSNDPLAVMAKLNTFFAPYQSFPFDDAAAAEYGRIRGQLADAGTRGGAAVGLRRHPRPDGLGEQVRCADSKA
jgi:tRNA(fMet)-specific endonuclease VapC